MKPTNNIYLITLLFSSLLFSHILNAKEVELKVIQQVAKNVFSTKTRLSSSDIDIKETIPIYNGIEIVFYIINFDKGHIVVSNDDVVEPILGYGLDSKLDLNNVPPGLLFLLNEYKNEISTIIKENIKQHKTIKDKWEKYSSKDYSSIKLKSYTEGDYLINTMWGGGGTYNRFCPYKTTGPPNRCPAGCGAVAVAQILHYWNDRVFPDDSQSYTNSSPNVNLSVDFWDEEYDWESMDTDDADDENAKLIFHSGVAIHSNYSDGATTSTSNNIMDGLVDYFGFNPSINEKYKSVYLASWDNLLRTEIDSERPVLYGGCDPDSGTCHLWIVDGYETVYNTYRCNWGWDGPNPNTWYTLTNLAVYPYNFSTSQSAFFNIEPMLDGSWEVSGETYVCSSNETYSISLPISTSVAWSKGFYLDQVGGNTSSTYVVNASTTSVSYSSWVRATIKNSQDQTCMVWTKDVGVNGPMSEEISLNLCNSSGTPVPYMCPDTYYHIYINNDGGCSLSDYSWSIPAGWDSMYQYDNMISVYTNSYPGGMIEVYATTCCQPNTKVIIDYLASGYCGGYYSMSFMPNPTSSETTVLIEPTSEDINFDENEEWELEVYNQSQVLKEKKTKLKGKETKIQTAGWKEGIYFIRVKYKDEYIEGKLVVKK